MKKRSWSLFGALAILTAVGCASESVGRSDATESAKSDDVTSSAVTTCGNLRDVCCANNVCNSGLVCDQTGGLCRVGVNCGLASQACCVGGRCAANLNCTSNSCSACGASGQACCGAGTASPCGAGLSCDSTSGTCKPPCGFAGQACCNGTDCNTDTLTCVGGTCRFSRIDP